MSYETGCQRSTYSRQTDAASKQFKTYNTKHRTIKLISNSNTAFQIHAKIDRINLRLKEVSEDDCLTLAGNAFQQSKYL